MHASIAGSTASRWLVTSIRIRIDASGAWTTAASTAPMPIRAKYPGGSPPAIPAWPSRVPSSDPVTAPMNSDGAITPPLPPLDRVRQVPTILASRMNVSSSSRWDTRTRPTISSPISCWMTPYPSL